MAKPRPHGPHEIVVLVSHDGDIEVGGCPTCMADPAAHAQRVREVLLDAARFVAANQHGRDELA